MSSRLPRWTAAMVLALLVGALLLMHGLGVKRTESSQSAAMAMTAMASEHPQHDAGSAINMGSAINTDHGSCGDCLAQHLMAACLTVIATLAGVALVRHTSARRSLGVLLSPAAPGALHLNRLLRPPDPAWVRLSVMRC